MQFEEIFRRLNDAQVRFIVVGGVAVVLHGYVRFTADLDLYVDLEQSQALKAMAVMTTAGFRPVVPVDAQQFADPEARQSWIDEKDALVFSMHEARSNDIVDFFIRHPIPFDEVWGRSSLIQLDTTDVRVVSIEDLIALKRLASRPKDMVDIAELQAIREKSRE